MQAVKILVCFFLCLVSNCFTQFTECPSENDFDAQVLIFGAGISGMAAAKSLYENGVTDILIIEGREEIGGRMRSVDFAGVKVEVGANWIHHLPEDKDDRDKHPIWKLAKDAPEGCNNLEGIDDPPNDDPRLKEVWDKNDNDIYVEQNLEKLQSMYTQAWDDATEDGKTIIMNDLEDITVRQGFVNNNWIPKTRLENLTEWCNFDFEFAEPPDITSLIGVTDDNDFDNGNHLITDQKGFSSVVKCIAKGIDEDKIMLSAVVNQISYSDSCVCADVTINNQDQQTFCGKYGLVTFSIGVLKDWIDSSKFNPELSQSKQNAIKAISMGFYLKIFVDFPSRFWNKKAHYILRADEKRGYFPVIQPIGSLIGCPNMILMTAVYSEAERLSQQDKDITKQEIMTVLKELYHDNIPEPKDILIPDWYSNNLYRGMFSNTRFGVTLQHKEDLAQPDGNLYFSGEGISKKLSGYLEGAYCTGLDASSSILKREGLTTSDTTLPNCDKFMTIPLENKEVPETTPSSGNKNKALQITVYLLIIISFIFL